LSRRAIGGATCRFIHRRSILIAEPAMAILGGGEGDASNERDRHHAVQCGPPYASHDTLP
jgi:hypothetical protein